MVKREDKLKSLLSGGASQSSGPEEVNLAGTISPVAKIKVI
jgi:hypothetical protein